MVFERHDGLFFPPCYRGGRSRAAVSQEDESEEEMETSQQSDEEADEEQSQESSPKVNPS